MKVEYWIEDYDTIGHKIEGEFLSLDKPEWFKKMPVRFTPEKKPLDFIRNHWDDFISGNIISNSINTVKACPGFTNLFKHSLAIKFPCDIAIETFADGTSRFFSNSQYSTFLNIDWHTPNQVAGHLHNYIMLKLQFDCWLNMKNSFFQYIDPIYYNEQPYIVAPGMAEASDFPINVILLFPKKDEKYVFQAGDVCAMLVSTKPITKLVHTDLKKSVTRRLWFLRKHFYSLSKETK